MTQVIYEASVTLTTKPKTVPKKEEIYRPIFLMHTDANNPQQNISKQNSTVYKKSYIL